MKCDIARFDTSDYLTDNGVPLANKKVSSLIKNEYNGAMIEFVGLRAKMQ